MNKIKNVTPDGITYINGAGEDCFVDFKECNENWIQYRKKIEQFNDEFADNIKKRDKYVGQRNSCSDPKFIEFFTYPKFTRFEFTRFAFQESEQCRNPEKSFSEFKNKIILAGWTTLDLS